MHNSQKRSLDDCEQKWKAYRLEAGKALKQRLEPPFKKPTKAKHVNFIYTRQVAYDEKKNKYVPTEIKQCVEMMCELEYDSVCENVWKYYQKEKGFRRDIYDLHLIIGPNGPIAVNTLQLDNKRDLFVMFERKVKVNKGSPSSSVQILYPSSTTTQGDGSSSYLGMVAKATCSVPPSAFPVTPSAIRKAAKIIETTTKAEDGMVQKLVYSEKGWAWMPEFPIKFVQGSTVAAGSFRTAFNAQLTELGELPKCQYVIKYWNERSIERRFSELESCNGVSVQTNTTMDLSKRAVQCQMVARGLAQKFGSLVSAEPAFGTIIEYIPAYVLRVGEIYGTIEPKLNGTFSKYMNNTMDELFIKNEYGLKASAFAHFTFEFTSKSLLVTDCQGTLNEFTDPEIASKTRYDGSDDDDQNELNFGFGNWGSQALQSFEETHECNKYCVMANLKPFNSAQN